MYMDLWRLDCWELYQFSDKKFPMCKTSGKELGTAINNKDKHFPRWTSQTGLTSDSRAGASQMLYLHKRTGVCSGLLLYIPFAGTFGYMECILEN
jgi:hypothetical protein